MVAGPILQFLLTHQEQVTPRHLPVHPANGGITRAVLVSQVILLIHHIQLVHPATGGTVRQVVVSQAPILIPHIQPPLPIVALATIGIRQVMCASLLVPARNIGMVLLGLQKVIILD